MALDYAGIINAGAGLMGGLREQLAMEDQRNALMQDRAKKLEQSRIAEQRTAAFREAAARAAQSSDPKAIGNLMIQFPEFADQIKPGWDALSEDAKRRNLTQSGTIFMRAKNGDTKGAAALLRQRYEADLAAGQADPGDKELIDALESGDPVKVQQATATIGFSIAAYDPSKFSETYGKLFPADATTTVQKEYQWRVQQFGKAKADEWLAVQDTKLVPVEKGGQVFDAADIIGARGGGFGGGIVATPEQQAESERVRAMFPDAPQFATDNPKGGDQSTGMGGVPAPALGPNGLPTTLTPDQYRVTVDALGKDKTDAWMRDNGITVENVARGGTAQAPVRVRSVQEARKLPSGTLFVTPDGRTMRKP